MTKSSLYRQTLRLATGQQSRGLTTRRILQASSVPRHVGPTNVDRRQIHSHSSSSSSSDPFTTVNASEISHFTRLSSEWWSETGEFALLHRMNPARVEYIRQKLLHSNEPEWTFETRHSHNDTTASGTGKWLKGKKVLDVGCGGGLLAESLARLGGDILAIDAGRENIEIARIHAEGDPHLPIGDRAGNGEKLEYRWIAAEKLREEGRKFDVVTSMEVIEHVDEPGEFLKCLGDMVKVGLRFSFHLLSSCINLHSPLVCLFFPLTLIHTDLRISLEEVS
jgi:polyprenyldihydroxybenzoate methyltransferase/3-demethylubiquinol 3-O-methyltransferase